MKFDPKTIRGRIVSLVIGILMNSNGGLAFADTNQKALTPDDALANLTQSSEKILLAGRGGGGGGHGGGGGRGGGYHGSSGSRTSSYHGSYRGSTGRTYSRSSVNRRSSSRSSGSKRTVAGTRTRTAGATTTKARATKSGARSKSTAMRSTGGRGGGGGGHHHGGHGRHHGGGHGHHGHNHYNNYWGYGHWYGGWGGWYYPWWGWCFGFGLGLGYGWYGPWWGFWDFPAYWAWYWPGFALSAFYAGLYDPQPYIIVLGQDSVNYYAVYERGDDGYVKVSETKSIDADEQKKIEIGDRSKNIIIVAKNKKALRDTISKKEAGSKDDYSVVDPTEAPDKPEEGETPEVTDEKIAEFQKTVNDRSKELKTKAQEAESTDTSEAEKEAQVWENKLKEKPAETAIEAD
jgi:hypothetical protein